MEVETFECQETAAEPIEASEEAIEIIRSMNLEGQAELITAPKAGRESRMPYRIITAEEDFVYRTLCPKQTALAKYKDGPVPLRVLQIAAHAHEIGLGHLFVWHRASPAVKDPVLVSRKNEYDWDTDNRETRILARWGDELETFAILFKRAVEAAKQKLIADAESLLSEVKVATGEKIVQKGASFRIAW